MPSINEIRVQRKGLPPKFGRGVDKIEIENVRLRELLHQAAVDAERLRTKAALNAIASDDAIRLQKLLVEELHHRAKNTLATVMAIASQSLKTAASVEEGRLAIEARLLALGRAQDVLLKAHWASVHLRDVIRAAVEPFDERNNARFFVSGATWDLPGEKILPLTLTLNELCTNALKYGALSVQGGRISIATAINQYSHSFKLTWTESGGPLVQIPARHGFGSRLISLLAEQLHGVAESGFEPQGLIYQLDAPVGISNSIQVAASVV